MSGEDLYNVFITVNAQVFGLLMPPWPQSDPAVQQGYALAAAIISGAPVQGQLSFGGLPSNIPTPAAPVVPTPAAADLDEVLNRLTEAQRQELYRKLHTMGCRIYKS